MKSVSASLLALAAMGLAQLSHAAPVTVTFSAVVTSPDSILAATGSTIQGAMTFGDEPSRTDLIAPSACGSAACASYFFDAAPTSIDVRLNNAIISSSVLGVAVYDNATLFTADGSPVDALEIGFRANGPSYILSFTGSPDSFSGAALSGAVASLATWQSGQFSVWFNSAAGPALQARVTEFTVTSVPEPASLALFAMGAGGIVVATKRRRCVSPTPQAVNDA